MQSTDLEEIKAAIFEQAYHPCTRVSLLSGASHDGQKEQGAIAGPAPGTGALVSCGSRDHRKAEAVSNRCLRHRGRLIGVRDPLPQSVLFLPDDWA